MYGIDRPLSDEEARALEVDLISFVDRWTAHGTKLRAGAGLVERRFIVIAVEESAAQASGCSIDDMVRYVTHLESRFQRSLLDGTLVFYRTAAGEIESCDRAGFRSLVEAGEITRATPVFDLTVASLGDVRSGKLELPVTESWHWRLATEVIETA